MEESTRRERLLYYTLGLAPSVGAREWVERDIETLGFVVRRTGMTVVGLLVGAVIGVWLFDAHPSFLIGALIGGVIAGLLQMTLLADFVRRRSLRYYEKRWDRQLSA